MSTARKLDAKANATSDHKADLRSLAEIVKEISGINLPEKKDTLLETRLSKRLAQLAISDLSEYIELIQCDDSEKQICIELLTTHKTEWFREKIHFQWLKSQLPTLRKENNTVNIWSAACSSGPEVYSILFLLLRESLTHSQFRILGTDISRSVLNTALSLPNSEEFKTQYEMLSRNFRNKECVEKELAISLQKSIKFREFNLKDSSLSTQIKFDVIFLRNVLIYFDRPTIKMVCRNLSRYLKADGHLILGLTESLSSDLPEFKFVGNSIYRFMPGSVR